MARRSQIERGMAADILEEREDGVLVVYFRATRETYLWRPVGDEWFTETGLLHELAGSSASSAARSRRGE